jgi:F0F1-type ATP synthase beta subunit
MAEAQGTIVQSIGAVIDIEFPREAMPNIYDALVLEDSGSGGLVEKGLTSRSSSSSATASCAASRSDPPTACAAA